MKSLDEMTSDEIVDIYVKMKRREWRRRDRATYVRSRGRICGTGKDQHESRLATVSDRLWDQRTKGL